MGYLSASKRKTTQQETRNYTAKCNSSIRRVFVKKEEDDELAVAEDVSSKDAKKLAKQLDKEMIEAVRKLEFSNTLLDQIAFLREKETKKKLQSKSVGGYNKRNMVYGNITLKMPHWDSLPAYFPDWYQSFILCPN